MECQICTDKIKNVKKGDKRPTVCRFCGFSACVECNKKYLLGSINDPHCMSCGHVWDREFIVKNLTITFVNGDYKKHRENVLLDRQKAMLPATQPYINSVKKIKENEKATEDLKREYNEELKRLESEMDMVTYNYRRNIDRIRLDTDNHRAYVDGTRPDPPPELDSQGTDTESSEKKLIFYGKCVKDGCNGYIMNGYICGVCNSHVCRSCMEILTDEKKHVCVPEIRASVESIRKDSKKCPSCSIYIHRIEGCAQMWCTSCHTAFNWNTGEILKTKHIHNPHLVEYLRTHGIREQNNCGVTYNQISNKFYNSYRKYSGLLAFCNELRDYHIKQINQESEYRKIRADFLIGKYDEKSFKEMLQRKEKEITKKTELNQIYETLVTVINDILRLGIDGNITPATMDKELQDVIYYADDQIRVVNKITGTTGGLLRNVPKPWIKSRHPEPKRKKQVEKQVENQDIIG